MIVYKHDGDGKIYYEMDGKVHWLCECIIDNAKGVAAVLNNSQTNIQQLKNAYSELEVWAIENCFDNPHVCNILEKIENSRKDS